MNWKQIGKDFLLLISILSVPCSWFTIITIVNRTFGDLAGIPAFLILMFFTLWYFFIKYNDWTE